MQRRSTRRLWALAAVLVAAIPLALPVGAGATTTCELSSGVLDVTMSASGDSASMGVDNQPPGATDRWGRRRRDRAIDDPIRAAYAHT